MKIILFILISLISFTTTAETLEKISTMDFIQIQKGYKDEALFFYKNNWKKFRHEAVEKGYIDSFLLLETEASKEAPFHIVLITTYLDKKQYQQREDNFQQLMQESKGPQFLNSIKPQTFRKKLFSKQEVISFN